MEGRRAEKRCGPEARGQALVAWLAATFTYHSLDAWHRELGLGRLRVNGRVATADCLLVPGDRIAYEAPPLSEPRVRTDYRVLLETQDFLVVDKPPLLPVHPGGPFFRHSLWALLTAAYGPVHFVSRLDRETSGLLLVARSPEAARDGQTAAEAGLLRKTYHCLVHGRFPEAWEARGCLAPDPASGVRKKRRFVSAAGEGDNLPGAGEKTEACHTRFRRLSIHPQLDLAVGVPREGPFSLVEADLVTGRTHQIRASLEARGFPLVGDKLYGGDPSCFLRFSQGTGTAADETFLLLEHQALHAARLWLGVSEGRLEAFDLHSPAPFLDLVRGADVPP